MFVARPSAHVPTMHSRVAQDFPARIRAALSSASGDVRAPDNVIVIA